MGRYIGMDLGTTTIAGLVLDTESAELVSSHTVANDAEAPSGEDRTAYRLMWQSIRREGER